MKVTREVYKLTGIEFSEFKQLPDKEGHAFKFWRKVAKSRDLDPKSIMDIDGRHFSALLEGHGKHWCYPYQLKSKFDAASQTIAV